jgi:hypothetical protein
MVVFAHFPVLLRFGKLVRNFIAFDACMSRNQPKLKLDVSLYFSSVLRMIAEAHVWLGPGSLC